MKPRSHWPIEKLQAFATAFLGLAFASLAAQSPTNAHAAGSLVATNAAPAQPEIPKSVFLLPTTPKEGKDPFFPRSMHPYGPAPFVLNTNTQAVSVAVELHLNGISGTMDRRLAIINNQTFQTNEEGEVPTNPGRARIRCVEIRADSVLVQVGGEQRVLRLRPVF
jgi:hypothetical protein